MSNEQRRTPSEGESAGRATYRAEVWESELGWHWRVEIDVRNGRAWSGIAESRLIAFRMAADRLAAIELEAKS